jgi:hypothetical protein
MISVDSSGEWGQADLWIPGSGDNHILQIWRQAVDQNNGRTRTGSNGEMGMVSRERDKEKYNYFLFF